MAKYHLMLLVKWLLLSSVIIFHCRLYADAVAVEFTFISPSSSIITLGQNATYHCLVNDTRVIITWNINGDSTLPAGITTTGLGTRNSTLTIPGVIQFNNTMVRCIASGFVDGTGYLNFSDSVLLIQGQLSSVNNLTCRYTTVGNISVILQCNWSPLFSLTPILNYFINITITGYEDTPWPALYKSTVNNFDTPLSYYGNYSVSVVGYNTVGFGVYSEPYNVSFLPQGNFTNNQVTYNHQLTYMGTWNVTCIFKNASYFRLDPLSIIAYLFPLDDTTNVPSSLSITVNDSNEGVYVGTTDFSISIDLGLVPNNTHWKLIIGLVYHSFDIYTSPTYEFNTFDIRNGSWSIDSTEIGRVHFTCVFIEGSLSIGCLIRYTSSVLNESLTINRNSLQDTSATAYVDNIVTNNYTISYYDLDYGFRPAYTLNGQYIIGINLTVTSSVIISTETLSSFSSLSVTLIASQTPPTQIEPSISILMIAIPIVLLFGVILGVTVIGLMICIIIKAKKRCRNKQLCSKDKSKTKAQKNRLNYTTVYNTPNPTSSSNHNDSNPHAPLPCDNTVSYSEVLLTESTIYTTAKYENVDMMSSGMFKINDDHKEEKETQANVAYGIVTPALASATVNEIQSNAAYGVVLYQATKH